MNKQREEALKRANKVRFANSATKRQISALPRKDGEEMVASIVADPVGPLGVLDLLSLLGTPKRRSRQTGMRLLRELNMHHRIRVGDLAERERKLLAAAIRAGYSTEGISFDEFGFARERVAA